MTPDEEDAVVTYVLKHVAYSHELYYKCNITAKTKYTYCSHRTVPAYYTACRCVVMRRAADRVGRNGYLCVVMNALQEVTEMEYRRDKAMSLL